MWSGHVVKIGEERQIKNMWDEQKDQTKENVPTLDDKGKNWNTVKEIMNNRKLYRNFIKSRLKTSTLQGVRGSVYVNPATE